MARLGTRAQLAGVQTTTDLELSPPSLRSSVELVPDDHHHRPSPAHAKDREYYVPPNGGYGWVCVVCVFLINAHTWGFNFVSWASCIVLWKSLDKKILTCRLHVVINGG